MAEPFLTEIRIFSCSFAPKGWAMCNGQLLAINQNQPAFSLLGITFGGNGQTTFALPNLQGRVPIHVGPGFGLGQRGGEEAHTLTQTEMPQHTHAVMADKRDADTNLPSGNLPAAAANAYAEPGSLTTLVPGTVTNTGGSQAHTNMQPYTVLNFCIALQGIFPSQT